MFFKKLKNEENYLEFKNIINDIRLHEKVKEMNNYMQHSSTSCYNHCLHVAYYTYLICKKFKLDYFSAARAAMLHDFFLYDWRTGTDHEGAHAFTHPETALSNAIEHFEINEKEADIILNHMWPLTITKMPSCKESFLVSAMDKYCSLKENFNRVKKVKWIPQFAK